MENVYTITAGELAARGKEAIPDELISGKHLIYSSPATLAFNSPGAQGFGVKRAGLSIPGSVMLLVAPGCCGRNTAALNALGYRERFFYMLMDDTDIVTGRHLTKISKAVKEIVDGLDPKPTAVMICITCVDALLGTDMERVCRKATEKSGVPVLPCYMYALTREGRMPPMTQVRKTVYQLLQPRKRKSRSVNILGEFAPFDDRSEIYELLHQAGITKIGELSRCRDFEEYLSMAEANFNLVLNPEAMPAAEDIYSRLGIPPIRLTRVYQIDKIRKQYQLFGSAIGVKLDDSQYYDRTLARVSEVSEKYRGLKVAVGEWLNANPFELSLALIRYGFRVTEIFATVTPEQFIYINKIAALSPDTKIYSNLQPTMLNYDCGAADNDLSIGQDAAFYNAVCPNIRWNDEIQPFGYDGLCRLFDAIDKKMEAEKA